MKKIFKLICLIGFILGISLVTSCSKEDEMGVGNTGGAGGTNYYNSKTVTDNPQNTETGNQK